ncbi:Y+L amino acid transporter 2-like [Babylonia areolata]|uniref:Y+L amino acid transporter 2-like n=1 Tax=Babylonia areolata TaxID=304850 RepID=UPI003FD10DDD
MLYKDSVNKTAMAANKDMTGSANTTNDDNNHTPITTEPLQLPRNLGLIPAISYVAGGIIGVGIFVSPQAVLLNTGKSVGVALCVWTFCAFLAFCGALCYAELGTRIRKSGGSYTYVRSAFGDGVGFVLLWTQLVVVRPMSTALGVLAASEYALRPVFVFCPHLAPAPAKVMLSVCILGLLVFLNSLSTRWVAVVQTVSTVCKLSSLVVIILIGLVFLIMHGPSESLQDPFSPQELSVQDITFAIYSCSFAYYGWDNLNMATEEVKNPQRNIPLAVLLAVVLATVVYLLANVSYHAVLTTPQMVSGVAVVAVFTQVTVPLLMWVMIPCIAISAVGMVNVNIFAVVRMTFIGGRDGLFPSVFSMINVSRKTPLVAALALGVAGSLVVLMVDNISSVLGSYVLFRTSGETLTILGMFRLRRKHPATDHTYVAPTAVAVLFVMLNVSLAMVAITRDISRYVTPLLVALTGIPVYFLSTSRVCSSQGPLGKLHGFFITMSQKFFLCDFATKTY